MYRFTVQDREQHRSGGLTLPWWVSLLLTAACSGTPEEPASDVVASRGGSPASSLNQPAVEARLARIRSAAKTGGPAAAETLARMAFEEANDQVRQAAVLSYAQTAGKAALPTLRAVAMRESNADVRSAALASLHRLRREHPEPERGHLDVDFPASFAASAPFEVVVHVTADEAAPRAMVNLQLPAGFTSPDPAGFLWKGSLAAGETRAIVFHAVAPGVSVRSGARVDAKLDYAGAFDLERFSARRRVVLDDAGGRFELKPPAIHRSAETGEVLP